MKMQSTPLIGKKTLALQVQTLSTKMMKPSTPTPLHLKSYKFCLLDQLFDLSYVPHFLLYKTSSNINKNMTTCLEESLSKTISLYYPLAGRLSNDKFTADCNDSGIIFIEARANITLEDFLQAPNRVELVSQFLPSINALELVPLAIQFSTFDCGGIALGCQYLHKIFDGVSWGNFLTSWAALAAEQYEKVITPVFFTAASLFPPCSWATPRCSKPLTARPLSGGDHEEDDDKGCSAKAFVLTPQAITELQDKARSELVPVPTRIEALSAFIWKHAVIAAAAVAASKSVEISGSAVLIHTVNMRPRTNPPIPQSAIGNLIIHATAFFKSAEFPTASLQGLVAETRKGLSEAKDANFLSKFQGDKGAEAIGLYRKKMADISKDKNITRYMFSSWSKLDVQPNFGFGIPVWTGFTGGKLSLEYRNLFILIENPDSGGIEAWLLLEEQEMDALQSDADFLAFASPST